MFSVIRGMLSSSLLLWEVAGYICTAVVVLGCIGEYVAEFTRVPRSDDARHKIAKLSLIVLTVGIAGELLTAIRSSQMSGRVIADLQATVRDARESASTAAGAATRAKAAADGAGTKAESVGKEADAIASKLTTLSQKTDAAGKSLTVLTEQVKPRSIFVMEKAGLLVNAAKPFARQSLEIRMYPAGIRDPKELDETRQLASTLRFLIGQVSGWSVSLAQGDDGWGVQVAVRRNSSEQTRKAADALVTALGDCGLMDSMGEKPKETPVKEGTAFDRENGPPDTIVLWVGERPEQIVNVREQ